MLGIATLGRGMSLSGARDQVVPEKAKSVARIEGGGSNLIEFTPTGYVTYTCWMGMISSAIRVVDNLDGVTGKDVKDVAKAGKSSTSGGSCCSAGSGAGSAGGTGEGCCSAGGGAGPQNGFSVKDLRIPMKKKYGQRVKNQGWSHITRSLKPAVKGGSSHREAAARLRSSPEAR